MADRPGLLILLGWLLAGVLAAAGSVLFGGSSAPVTTVLGLVLLFAVATAIPVPSTSGNPYSLALAVAAAAPLVLREVDRVDASAVGSVYAFGVAASLFVSFLLRNDRTRLLTETVRRVVGLALALGVYVGTEALLAEVIGTGDAARLIAVGVAGLGWFLAETWLWAYSSTGGARVSHRYLWLLALEDWAVPTTLLASGALFGFAWTPFSWWAVAVAAIPYSIAHIGFDRYQTTRRTYGQTIRALARIPEAAGLSPEGHAERTAELAVSIAQDLALSPNEVTEVGLSALMHDIGRITLNEPSIIRKGYTDEDIAGWGAEIIAEAPYLVNVADVVRRQHHPYRQPGQERDEDLPMASKIIRAASAYDQAVHESGFGPLEALEVLHRGAAYDHDPEVVASLRRILKLHNRLGRR